MMRYRFYGQQYSPLARQVISSHGLLRIQSASICTTAASTTGTSDMGMVSRSSISISPMKDQRQASSCATSNAVKFQRCLLSHSQLRHLTTTSSCHGGDSDEERVSQAYLHGAGVHAVQKHDGNRLIYEVRGQTVLRIVSLSFYATAALGLYVAPDFISTAWESDAMNHETVTNLLGVALAVLGLPCGLRMLSKRLILKLYHNEARETYLAVTQSMLLNNKMTKFSLDDVVVIHKKGVFNRMFNLTSFKANRKPFYVNPYNFKLPSDYNHLHGFDR